MQKTILLDDDVVAALAEISRAEEEPHRLAQVGNVNPEEFKQFIESVGVSDDPDALALLAAANVVQAREGVQESRAKTTKELLIEQLRDLYHAEKQLLKALPRMAKAAHSDKLRHAFQLHIEQTNGQVERLEQVFDQLDTASRGKRCEAMESLIEEAKEVMEEITTPQVRDVALIAAAQKVEHYEIASYGSVRALAEAMGHGEVAQLLEETLNEEKEADQKLNQLAISDINKTALDSTA